MAIELLTWAAKTILPMYDAILQDVCVGRSGILHGCTATASGNTLIVAAGYGVIKGRLFKVTSTTINVTLSSGADLYGVLYVKLDLSNSSTPLTIEVNTNSSGYYEVTEDDDVNYTDGVYEIELARFIVGTSAISGLTLTKASVPYNRTPVYASLDDFGRESRSYITTFVRAMAHNSIAVMDETALIDSELPYSGAEGILLILRNDKDEANLSKNARVYFLTNYDEPDYQYGNTWIKLPHSSDLYYGMNETVTLGVCTGGFITGGGTQIIFNVPTHKILQSGRSLALLTGQIKVRQNGQYLIGSGSAYQEINTDLETTFHVYDNVISVICTDSRGFGGTNNAPVGVDGWVRFIEN